MNIRGRERIGRGEEVRQVKEMRGGLVFARSYCSSPAPWPSDKQAQTDIKTAEKVVVDGRCPCTLFSLFLCPSVYPVFPPVIETGEKFVDKVYFTPMTVPLSDLPLVRKFRMKTTGGSLMDGNKALICSKGFCD